MSLNLARQDRFLPDVHIDEKVWVRQSLNGAVQPAEGSVRLREQDLKITLQANGRYRRQGCRQKRAVARRFLYISASPD